MVGYGNNNYNNNNNFRNNNGGGGEDKVYSPVVYSNYRMNNYDSSVGTNALRFSFWQGLLKIYIVPCVRNGNNIEYRDKETVLSYINPTKARILSNMVKEFVKNYNENGSAESVGITCTHANNTESIINISDGSDFNINEPSPVISIKVFQSGSKTLIGSAAYQTRPNTFYGITGSTDNDPTKFTVAETANDVNFKILELYELIEILDSYAESMTNSMAYSVIEQMKWNDNRFNKKLDTIQEALGVSNRQSSGRSNNMFNNGRSNNSYTNIGNGYGD